MSGTRREHARTLPLRGERVPTTSSITICRTPAFASESRFAPASVLSAWPNPARDTPRVETVEFARFVADLLGPSDDDEFWSAPVLIGLGPDIDSDRARRIVDKLRQHSACGVILSDDDTLATMQGGGLFICGADTPTERVSLMLYTLLQRQPVVDAIQRDLRIVTALQGGVRGEMSRIHDELNLAATMQRESLPKTMPKLNGVEFGVIFRPAAYVSGDIYDVEVVDDERIGFFVADAVGHGVPAALLTMIISRALSFHTREQDEIEPARALARLNDELVRTQHGKSRFATGVYGLLNTRSRELSIASAGHPAPIIFRDGSLEKLSVEGPLLGVFESEQYAQATVPLNEGDTLLIYTDGFETAFPSTEEAAWRPRQGTQNYIDRLAAQQWPSRQRPAPLDTTLRELQRELDLSAGSLHQVDDVTAMAISLTRQVQPSAVCSAGAA